MDTPKSSTMNDSDSSKKSLSQQTIDVFEEKFGKHPGKRRNHIDGICFTATFQVNDSSIREWTNSKIFSDIPLPAVGRFSHKGGIKKNENIPGEYGMAFQIQLPDESFQNFSMNTLDFFPVNTPEGFLQLMQAKVSGKKEDFEQLKNDHPEFANFKKHYSEKGVQTLKVYPNLRFNSINTFKLESANGEQTAIRWSFEPRNPPIPFDANDTIDFYTLTKKALKEHKVLIWDMIIYFANPDDPINDASQAWIGEHKSLVAATLTIESVEKEGICNDINFDPLKLLDGMKPSNDPVLRFRSPAYAAAFARRVHESYSK